MRIHSAEFLLSASTKRQFPAETLPEIAFAGRSNVGKSTLINSLLNRKKLVKTSATPGKTQLINFFKVNNKFYFVDLPGYGYAKVPESVRRKWKYLVEAYLSDRKTLRNVVLIIDSRHNPTKQDRQLLEWLKYFQRPSLIVASKIDKLKRGQVKNNLQKIKNNLSIESAPVGHSSMHYGSREEIWKKLDPWIKT
jgi:ribosome biogenesis GTP-binding protein YsxC/EngB